MRKLLILLLLMISVTGFSQKAPAKFGDIPMEDMKMAVYPLDSAAEAVVLVDYGQSSINYFQGKGFKLTFERLRRVKILSKEGLHWANFSIPLYHDGDLEEKISGLKVVTYNLENGKVAETKVKGESFMREKYDVNRDFMKVVWTNVKEGSVIEISYKVISDFIFNFQNWEFQTTIPTCLSEYRAKIPEYFNYEKYMQGYIPLDINESQLGTNFFTINSTQHTSTERAANPTTFSQDKIEFNETSFRWGAKNIPAFKPEPFISSSKNYISKIDFELAYTQYPQQFTNPGIKRYMGTWADINRSYLERVGGEISGNGSLKSKVEEITAGISDPLQKTTAIYNYVKQNVLWDENYAKYPDSSPKKTLEDKKGNAAEINFLLASLLDKSEIPANVVLLSTRDHGFVRESVPVSSQFNYVVCLANVGDKQILLDATDKFLPAGMLPNRCINGKGFVVSKEGFQWISLQPSSKSKIIVSADLALTDVGELKGLLKIDRTGYNSADARRSYVAKGEKDYIQEFAKGRSWVISKSDFQNVNEISMPFKEAHELVINEHFSEAGSTIYMNPFVTERWDENPFKLEKRNYPVDFAHPFDQMYLAKIVIPEGFSVDELPASKVLALPGNTARYSYNVIQSGNTISITSNLSINKGIYTQEEYLGLREFYSQVVAKQAEQIVLKKK